jgi:hypothetical protein
MNVDSRDFNANLYRIVVQARLPDHGYKKTWPSIARQRAPCTIWCSRSELVLPKGGSRSPPGGSADRAGAARRHRGSRAGDLPNITTEVSPNEGLAAAGFPTPPLPPLPYCDGLRKGDSAGPPVAWHAFSRRIRDENVPKVVDLVGGFETDPADVASQPGVTAVRDC